MLFIHLDDETPALFVGVALPVEVVEWTAESTKIRLPKLDVGTATKAELEVVRLSGGLLRPGRRSGYGLEREHLAQKPVSYKLVYEHLARAPGTG